MGKLVTKVDEWSKITTDPWILESVRAYRLEFKTKPIQISPPLQPSRSEGECKLIQREIDSLLLKGAITVAQHSKEESLSNIFLVPKKTGDLRPVINLKPSNEFVHDIHFKMENIESVKQLLRTGDFMATIVLKDAYFSIPLTYATAHTCGSSGTIHFMNSHVSHLATVWHHEPLQKSLNLHRLFYAVRALELFVT